jgi:hypothetical protein
LDVVNTAELPWGESLVRQRGGNIAHKLIFEGKEKSPDNYMLVLAKEANDFYSPRHRHPWDQVRFCLEGKIPIAKGMFVDGGEIAYFPESVVYGPQEGGTDRTVLLLQFGGASGQGFIGVKRLNAAREALEKSGRFEKGVFVRDRGEGRKRQDAYEAIWEHVTGQPLAYAEPAFKAPIVMRPAALPWTATRASGVMERRIGVFPRRGLVIRMLWLAPGSKIELAATDDLRLLFVVAGGGAIGRKPLQLHSAVRIASGEAAELRSADGAEVLELSVASVTARVPP